MSSYDSLTVQAVWKSVVESDQEPANAFSSLLTHLKGSAPNVSGKNTETRLSSRDSCLASQVGIALMKKYADVQHWQSAFIILHHLHQFGVHYVTSQPLCLPLPGSESSSLSPCRVAVMAVTVCLMVDQVAGAVEVLNGCHWLPDCRPEEREERTQLFIDVAERCLEVDRFGDCRKCLEEIHSSLLKSKFFTKVAKLHNGLLNSALRANDVELAQHVYEGIKAANLPCVPANFSLLLEKLCGVEQIELARDLCRSVLDKQFYLPISRGNLFAVTLPACIHQVEVHLLLEEHLQKMARELNGKQLLPLSIDFDAGKVVLCGACDCILQVSLYWLLF